MQRMILVAALLLGSGVAAYADMSHYTNLLKQARGDDQLHVDAQDCVARAGPDLNGVPVTAAYKRCMRQHGWRYDSTTVEHTWIDPDSGLTCHAILNGFGSECSNF